MISLSRIVALGCVGLVACGHGGGGREIVRLAVGSRSVETEDPGDERSTRGVILRNAGDGWVSVGEDVLGEDRLIDAVFASVDVVWAFGNASLVRSTDGGRTWRDIVPDLPQDLREGPYLIHSLAFADARTGYLAARSVTPTGFPLDAPFVWITRDGGETWESEDVTPMSQEVGFAVGARAGQAELLRHPLTAELGAVVQGFDGNDHPLQKITTVPTIIRHGVDAVGERGWIAVTVIPGEDFVETRPVILTSERPGALWTTQPLPDGYVHDFGSIDMCDAHLGVAAGTILVPAIRPIVFRTENGGAAWETSELPTLDGESIVNDVTCVSDDEMWVVTSRGLLRSEDGGHAFATVQVAATAPNDLLGFASNAEFH